MPSAAPGPVAVLGSQRPARCLQVSPGLRSRSRREIALTFGRLRGRGVRCRRRRRFLLHRIQLGLSWRLRRRLVSLRSRPDHRPIDEFISVGMDPDAVGKGPALHQRGRRSHFGSRIGFCGVGFFMLCRRFRSHRDHRGSGGEGDNEEKFSDHIDFEFLFLLRGKPGRWAAALCNRQTRYS